MPKRKRIISVSKHGTPRTRQPIKGSVKDYLRMANAGKSKRKPSMPKVPWDQDG